MAQRINPEAFTPGEYIREELGERGWTQLDLAEILGRPPQVVRASRFVVRTHFLFSTDLTD